MSILDSHKKIAFDFDGTLVYSKCSPGFHEYILSHPEKQYFIITHRSSAEAKSIPEELAKSTPLSEDNFERIIVCPDRLKFEFSHDQQIRKNSGMPPISDETDINTMFPGEQKYVNWKGFVAKKLGASILIDDMPSMTEQGAKRNGVKFVNARNC